MNHSFLASIFGLSSALIWGAGDFCGGLSSRRAPLLGVLILAESTGFTLLVVAGLISGEVIPARTEFVYAVAAGLSGTIGLGCLYRGLAIERASIVAPVSAVVGVAIPAVFAAYTVGLPGTLKLVGFVLAIAAIVLASHSTHVTKKNHGLPLALLAGLTFGGFFIYMDLASGHGSTFYPLAIARGFPIPILLLIAFVRAAPGLPPRNAVFLIVLTGLLDAIGTVFFILSTTLGRLDVATILSSLYPASTVMLSRLLLHEPITPLQKFGVLLALTAIVLIAW
jgi:drug/metabolite transporter (DMT)-like permease